MKDLILIFAGVGIGYMIAQTLKNTEGVTTPQDPGTPCLNIPCKSVGVGGFRPKLTVV